MKTFIRIIALLSVLAAASCQQFKIDTQMTPEKAAANIRLVCSALDSYNVPATNPGTITFNVSSNTPWTIIRSSGADWVTVTPSSSATSSLISDVVVTIANNTGMADRSATLTVKGDNILNSKVITIKQDRHGKLYVQPMSGDFSAKGGPLGFTVQSNLDWEVRSSESWITFSRDGGAPDPDGKAITVTATAAPSTQLERSAIITVTAGDDEESFEVFQKGVFELTEISGPFAAAGASQNISLRTDLPWSISADKDWISFNPDKGEGDGNKIAIAATAAANDGAKREATVTVTVGDATKEFVVKQSSLVDFEIVAPASTEFPAAGGEVTLEVVASIAWTPGSEVDSWTITPVDDTHFKVTAAYNDKFAAKAGKVFITGAGGLKYEIAFTQDINFTFSGHTEVLEDGSVKVFEDEKSTVKTKEEYQYSVVDFDVEMHLGDKGTFMLITQNSGYEYELEINVPRPKYRVRRAGEKTGSSSDAKDFVFSQTAANAMTHGQFKVIPDAADATKINLSFFCDGTQMGETLVGQSAYAGAPDVKACFSFENIPSNEGTSYLNSDSYFIIKSCKVTPVTE